MIDKSAYRRISSKADSGLKVIESLKANIHPDLQSKELDRLLLEVHYALSVVARMSSRLAETGRPISKHWNGRKISEMDSSAVVAAQQVAASRYYNADRTGVRTPTRLLDDLDDAQFALNNELALRRAVSMGRRPKRRAIGKLNDQPLNVAVSFVDKQANNK